MENSIIIILLLLILMVAFGFYLIYTNPSRKTDNVQDPGIRIVGTEGSIVSVRKVAEDGGYEVKVDSIPIVDMYDEGEFLYHEESPMERWLRSDISDEERRLLHEELKTRYGIDMGWTPTSSESASDEDETDVVETEVDPDTLIPVGKVNRFEGYNPFAEEGVQSIDEKQVLGLLKFIIDNYSKGLLRPEVLVTASERYGSSVAEKDVDLEQLRRQQDLTGVKVDQELLEMSFEEFDMYVHDAVATAAVSEVMTDDVVHDVTSGEQSDVDSQEETEDEGSLSAGEENTVQSEKLDTDISQAKPYDWDDLDED